MVKEGAHPLRFLSYSGIATLPLRRKRTNTNKLNRAYQQYQTVSASTTTISTIAISKHTTTNITPRPPSHPSLQSATLSTLCRATLHNAQTPDPQNTGSPRVRPTSFPAASPESLARLPPLPPPPTATVTQFPRLHPHLWAPGNARSYVPRKCRRRHDFERAVVRCSMGHMLLGLSSPGDVFQVRGLGLVRFLLAHLFRRTFRK